MIAAVLLTVLIPSDSPEPLEGRGKVESRASTSSARTKENSTPLDAERAFIADAKTIGQWTAFRKWAAPDAIFLPPKPITEALKDAKDPPRSVDWWPTASYLSCDGKVGANTGGALWPGGRHSYFSTIWVKQPDGQWRYRLDHGDDLSTPRSKASGPAIRRASCNGVPPHPSPLMAPAGVETGGGGSPDRTLRWNWSVGTNGEVLFDVKLWMGDRYDTVIADVRSLTPPAPAK